MRRDELLAALRAVAARPAVRARARLAWGEIRRRPDAVVALALFAGVVAMILHWG
jgi:hypothetical protein